MPRCTCPQYHVPDARPLSPGDCPVHAPDTITCPTCGGSGGIVKPKKGKK